MEALNYIANDNVPPTTWRTIVSSIFHYSTLPIVISVRKATSILLTIFSPLIYLGAFFSQVALYPISILWKLEVCIHPIIYGVEAYNHQTLYIYLGIAAFIGLLTGFTLYFFSSMLISIFSLDKPGPPLLDLSSKSFYSNGSTLGNWSEATLTIADEPDRDESIPWYSGSLRKQNADVLSRKTGRDGLRSQVILEEDSDESHF